MFDTRGGSHGVVFGPRGVIQLRYLIQRKQMIKCSKAFRRLKTVLR